MIKAIFNGKIIDESKATISITDKGYFFDFAVYSSIKVVQGKIFFLEYHITRLFESAQLIQLNHQFAGEDVFAWLNKLVDANKIQDGLLRIILIGDPDNNMEAKLFIFSVTGITYYPKQLYRDGAKVITYQGERRVPQSKTKDLLLSFLAFREAKKQGAIEALLVDREGNIREGTRSNFCAVKGKTIIIPPSDKVLEGITEKIISLIVKKYFNIKREDISFSKTKEYDEFFLTSTLFNIMPIRQINDDIIFKSNFSNTKLIAKLFKEYYDKTILQK